METPAEIENQTYGSQLIADEPSSNQLVTQRYNLSENLTMFQLDTYIIKKQKNDEAISKLKRRGSGKKSVITMKINQINEPAEEHGNRTKLKFLHGKLLEGKSGVTDLQKRLMEELQGGQPKKIKKSSFFLAKLILFRAWKRQNGYLFPAWLKI